MHFTTAVLRFAAIHLCCLFLLLTETQAQKPIIKNLVFEGGGIRGIAYAGVLEELEKNKILGHVENVGGTSAGAITAMLVSLGYSATEIAAIIHSTKFTSFNDGKYIFLGGLARMRNRFGWYRGEKFAHWLETLIELKTGNGQITFAELSAKGFKDLYVTGTCLNKQQMMIFSKQSFPNMKVKDAVRISMSIPLYFTAVFIDSIGNVFKKLEKDKQLDVLVDGGIIGNYPIFIFDKTSTDSNNKVFRTPNPETLGIRLDDDRQIAQDKVEKKLVSESIENFNEYVSAFYVFILENLNRNQLTGEDWKRTISVSSVGIGPRIKKLSKPQTDALLESGRKATAVYFLTVEK